MNLERYRNRIAKLGPRPPAWRPKPTTSETRQELARFIAEIASRPIPAVAPQLSEANKESLRAAQSELERVSAILGRLYPDEVAT